MNQVAIVGFGYVGHAVHKVFPDALVYDPRLSGAQFNELTEAGVRLAQKNEINSQCGLAIICVPTPMQDSPDEFKAVDLSIVEKTVSWLQTPLVLIKSTVPPGTTDRLERQTGKSICFSPEYVGEGKYHISEWRYMSPTDPRTHEFLIIGGRPDVRDRVANYFVRRLGPEKVYYLIDAVEAEIIKYMENSWGALKVVFANEFYQLCQSMGASYIRVREGWALDNRVERMHTAVFVDHEGFSGKCYPKDLNGIVSHADRLGVNLSLVKTALRENAAIQSGAALDGRKNGSARPRARAATLDQSSEKLGSLVRQSAI
jgi:UDPglucose 6-dehydrogenase